MMGSGHQAQGSAFQAAKHRINASLEKLRDELKAIHEQDLSLLRQLMHIHHSITLLTGSKHKRSHSLECLPGLGPPSPDRARASMEPRRSYPALGRLHSMPFHSKSEENCENDESDDETEEETSDISNCSDVMAYDQNGPVHREFAMFYPLPFNLRHSPCFLYQSSDSDEKDAQIPVNGPTSSDSLRYATANQTVPEQYDVTEYQDYEPIRRVPERKALRNYELSYSEFLKRSSQVWREVQKEQEETGTVNAKKRATLSVFL